MLSSAKLTARARIERLDRGAVREALWEERRLVKTWAMPGTVLLLPSRELTLWQAAFNTDPHGVARGEGEAQRLAEFLAGPLELRWK